VTAPYPDTSEAPGHPLAPEPAVQTGALIGYARVSTSGQLQDRQQHALAEAGCLRVFADKLSGKNADRPELAACLDYLRPGDTLVVPSLDRLFRSLADLIQIVGTLRRHGVGFKGLHEALNTTTPGGRLVFHVFAALAEFIRELIVEGTREGLDAARVRGARLGRPPGPSPAPGSAARLTCSHLPGVSRAPRLHRLSGSVWPPGPSELDGATVHNRRVCATGRRLSPRCVTSRRTPGGLLPAPCPALTVARPAISGWWSTKRPLK